jgi:hypothetical protein
VRYRDNGGIIGPPDVASQNAASGVWSISEEEVDIQAGVWPLQSPPYVEYLALSGGGSYTAGTQGVIITYPYNLTLYNTQYVIPYNTPTAITIGSLLVIAYPNIYSAIRLISTGLSYSVTNGIQRPGYYVYTFTNGSGTITF